MTENNLSPLDRQALEEFVAYLHTTFPHKVRQVALFGSKARGDSQEDSDIDVLVILSREDRKIRREIIRQAARLSLKHDVLLSPRVIGADRWEQMKKFSLYQNVARDAENLGWVSGNLTLEASQFTR